MKHFLNVVLEVLRHSFRKPVIYDFETDEEPVDMEEKSTCQQETKDRFKIGSPSIDLELVCNHIDDLGHHIESGVEEYFQS